MLTVLQRTVYKLGLRLPIALPLDEITGLNPFDDFGDRVNYLFSKAGAGNVGQYLIKKCTGCKMWLCAKDRIYFISSQLNVALPVTHWPHSITGDTRMRCPSLATRSWLRIAPMRWNSWFCWRRITLSRTILMWKSLTCECLLQIGNKLCFLWLSSWQNLIQFWFLQLQWYWSVPEEQWSDFKC